ncbi:S-DNA-T family DNA segregation ATPase FtsK/SpoIIIE [Kribbella sp. VKM Ac-2571]|uniref:FtsK/SpoIIIE domain-containing protein n=1 Tax=Kribbella sp. VKM Ac-2571 TaxID=2512222 RepID=UPI00105B5247|nr:FtsK/SpoIIIE domain-containing protein [Kribbella sp. VKM Ac-2571]TDO62589.1 S-DNA-T family DNA segregation ATPase FtsK/SpoIIIE [Kribbella sp. VKM Ac-2571]
MGKIKTGRDAAGGVPVVRMLASQLRHPGVMLPILLVGFVAWWGFSHGWAWIITAGGLLVLVLGVWRWRRPDSFRRLVWWRVKAWWRRWFTYAPSWWWWMGRFGLSIKTEVREWIVRPRIVKVRSNASTDSLLLELPDGITPGDVADCLDKLQHATHARRATTRQANPGQVWLDLYMRDPLVKTIPAVPVPENLRVEDLDGLVIGYAEDGSPWRLRVQGTHILVAGGTGSGKSAIIWSTLRALAPYIRAGLVQVHAIDPKGGMELDFGRDLFHRYEADDYEAMVSLLEQDADELDERARYLRGRARRFTVSTQTPLVLIIVDELMQLTTLLPGPDGRRQMGRVETALGRLLSKGRGPGYAVLATVVEPTKDIVTWRDIFPDRIALRLGSSSQVDMVLGEGQRDLGAEADNIALSLPGVGFIKVENSPVPIRVRAAYVTDDEIKAMARDYRPAHHLRPVDTTADVVDVDELDGTEETGEAA